MRSMRTARTFYDQKLSSEIHFASGRIRHGLLWNPLAMFSTSIESERIICTLQNQHNNITLSRLSHEIVHYFYLIDDVNIGSALRPVRIDLYGLCLSNYITIMSVGT